VFVYRSANEELGAIGTCRSIGQRSVVWKCLRSTTLHCACFPSI